MPGHPLGKNPGDVWRIATRGFPGAHFATFPPELVRRPILATCPGLVCSDCGKAWGHAAGGDGPAGPTCRFAAAPRPGVVLDPFFGTGTVGLVARELGRDWLGIELNSEYAQLARERLGLDLEAAA
jgi:DNA modification methylase